MKVITLTENTSLQEDLRAEHGLSLYVQTGNRKLLFDCGQTGLFKENAEKLGVDLGQVDTMVLSHGHYDHGGGLYTFLDVNSKAPIYASDLCFGDFYNGTKKYIGLNPTLRDCSRILAVPDPLSLGDGLTLTPGRMVITSEPIPYFGLNVKHKTFFTKDCFLHEQYLTVEEDGKKILFSGCSHRGILNIARHFLPGVLIGGFHFKKLDPVNDREELIRYGQQLLELPTVYYTCPVQWQV